MTTGVIGHARTLLRWKQWSGQNWKPGEKRGTVHNYSMWQITCQSGRNADFVHTRYPRELILWCHPGVLKNSSAAAGCNNHVVRKLSELVNSQQLLADIIEGKGTVSLIETQLRRVLKLAKKIKKLPAAFLNFKGKKQGEVVLKPKNIRGHGKRRNVKKIKDKVDLSVVPAEWLSFWFGAFPLYSSLTSFGEIFDVPFEAKPFRITSPKQVMVNINDKTGNRIFIEGSLRATGSVRIVNPNVGVMQRSGLNAFISTAWEVAPWSWAVDYFVNIGEMLANFSGMFDNVQWIDPCSTWRFNGYDECIGYSFPGLKKNTVQKCLQASMMREPIVPTTYKLQSNVYLSVRKASYLASAIALTLKGKKP